MRASQITDGLDGTLTEGSSLLVGVSFSFPHTFTQHGKTFSGDLAVLCFLLVYL